MIKRPRRLRKNSIVRELVAETKISKDMFIYPYFVVEGVNIIHPIDAMPGIHHYSIDELIKDIDYGLNIGINKILLFLLFLINKIKSNGIAINEKYC